MANIHETSHSQIDNLSTPHAQDARNARIQDNKTWVQMLLQYNFLFWYIDTKYIEAKENALTKKARETGEIAENERIAVKTGHTIITHVTDIVNGLQQVYNRSKKAGHLRFDKTDIPIEVEHGKVEYLSEPEAELYVCMYLLYKNYTKTHTLVEWYVKEPLGKRSISTDIRDVLCYPSAILKLTITPTKHQFQKVNTVLHEMQEKDEQGLLDETDAEVQALAGGLAEFVRGEVKRRLYNA